MASTFSAKTQDLINKAFSDKDAAAAADATLSNANADLVKAQTEVTDATGAATKAHQAAGTSAAAALQAVAGDLGASISAKP